MKYYLEFVSNYNGCIGSEFEVMKGSLKKAIEYCKKKYFSKNGDNYYTYFNITDKKDDSLFNSEMIPIIDKIKHNKYHF